MLLRPFITVALVLAVGAPVTAIALWRTRGTSKAAFGNVAAVAALMTIDEIILRAPGLAVFSRLQWNWQGKILEACLAIVTILALRMTRDEAAVRQPRPNWVRPTLFAAVAILVLPLMFFLAVHARERLTREGWAFQFTMPGLAEELLFRGVIQGLLNRTLGKQWQLFGTQIGWGWLITSILFAAGHVVSVDRQLNIQFILDDGIGPLIGSLIGGWLRERTASLWPVVIVHNISNVLIPALTLLGPR